MHAVATLALVVLISIVCLFCAESLNHSSSSASSSPFTAGPHLFKSSRKKFSKPEKIKCDTYCCNCNGDRARCTGQNNRKFLYLPRLPANIRDFRMFRSRFHHLKRTMMLNLSNFDIFVMNLMNNQIHLIDPDAFADFPKIQVLDLSLNPILVPQLRESLKGMSSRSLSTLAIGGMGITSLPDNFFDMFNNRTFRKVDLQQNRLKSLNSALFLPFLHIDILNMAKNRIRDVNMSARVRIEKLILEDNQLLEFPDLSLSTSESVDDEQGEEALIGLRTLIISRNPFGRINPRVLRGASLPRLRQLDISSSAMLTTLENQFVADLPWLKLLVVSNMEIKRYEPYAFNSSSLVDLRLNGNRLFHEGTVDIARMFQHCPNLEKLSLVNTKLQMSTKEFFSFLVPLKSVRYLNLQKNRRGVIPPDLLWRLPNLTKLIFTGNNLNSYVLGKALEKVTSIRRLNVQANGIMEVNESTLPWEFRKNLEWLDISLNPFSCTCQLLWFRNWVDAVEKNKTVKVNNFRSEEYRCRTPRSLAETPLHEYRPTAESCAVRNPFILVGVVGACLLTGMLTLSFFAYRYRWHLRYYIYRLRRRRQYVQIPRTAQNENGDQIHMFTYDAYLAHSPKDLDWLVETLLPIVEGEHGLKVFVEERDSIPGTVLVDNIARYMDESARIMLLISDHYNREGWRQCEFEHILFAAFEQHKDVIVLLLGDVDAGRMTNDMRRMLTRGTFLQWGESEEAQRVFRNGLKVAIKTQDASFQNLC